MTENGMLKPHWCKFLMNGKAVYGCSECDTVFDLNGETPKENEYFYCPKCGNRMAEFVEDTEKELLVS